MPNEFQALKKERCMQCPPLWALAVAIPALLTILLKMKTSGADGMKDQPTVTTTSLPLKATPYL